MLKRIIQSASCDINFGVSRGLLPCLAVQPPNKEPVHSNGVLEQYNGFGKSMNQIRSLHQSPIRQMNYKPPEGWLKYNEVVFSPTKEGEPERPAEVYHQRNHVRYQHDKMLYLCRMIRGMSIDDAKKQLSFKDRAGATILKEVLEEAQEMAIKDHNVEFRSNMWVAEAFPRPAGFMKGVRKHGRLYMGVVRYRYIHLFVKLREGEPPEHYYTPKLNGHQHKERYLADLRKRRIIHSL